MNKIDFESSCTQSTLVILQDIISRMSVNSANVKTWCVALISAILVLLAANKIPELIFISLLPLVVFCLLDAYYLALERQFRERYNIFVRKLHIGEAKIDDLFIVLPTGQNAISISSYLKSIFSFSIWPFYILQISILIILKYLLF